MNPTDRRACVRSSDVTDDEPRFRRRFGPALAAILVAAFAGAVAAPARAEDGEGEEGEEAEGDDVSARIREQMEKIARLMRENEEALLEASRVGGRDPGPVEVTPPPTPESADSPEGAAPPRHQPPEGIAPPPEGGTPRERGEEIRRRMDDLIRGSSERGGRIPRELEELVRMIPRQRGQGSPDPNAPKEEAERRRREGPKEPEETSGEQKKPEDGQPRPTEEPQSGPPPEGGAGDPARPDVPPWIQELPPEVRRKIVAQDFESVPEAYRTLIRRYLRWLAEQSNPSR
jgi:hypothetical protein